MKDRTLIGTGVIGGVVAAVCCATPILAIALAGVGLSAWAAKADYVLIPVILLCLGLVGWALLRRHRQKEI
jgi:mercuric ion transport protein